MRTRVSSKGQIVIPKAVRNHYRWKPGTVLKIEETEAGVVLSPVGIASVPQKEVFGCLKNKVSKTVTIEEMDDAVDREARRSHEVSR